MAKKTALSKPILQQPVPPDRTNVVINCTFSRPVYNALSDYKKDMGLSGEQEVVRLAVATFLKREGYLPSIS